MTLVVDYMPQLGITRVSRWIFNCYVIHDGDGGSVVVDAGLPRAADDLEPILRNLAGSLQTIVATHTHSDHVAGAPELAKCHGAPIHLPARALAYLDGERPRNPTPSQVAKIWPVFLDQPFDHRGAIGLVRGQRVAGFGTSGTMRWSGPRPDSGLTDGQPLPGAPAWTVLSTAGHTDDSIALWNQESQTLISGDAVLCVGGRVWHTPEVVDTHAARASAARLQALQVAHLLPGHGRPVHAQSTVWEQKHRRGA
ncbi:MBL fold metallo-hydrolase [Mycobacterium sp. CBMA 234]|uniref:MBL fold metallo-hydrolase n=1 Tax=Mycolicibacterium sp. CBMA 234 TaxID=1918495 RepID=UPI0012DF0D3C|nr:MBL fold metallo-hydrolase [Mycolicibacterium sp. CBMA 234]MUL67117.1 MBL fold metallo-hydrolase [Mycolicibacterium sp. CBMA 234]